MLMYTLGVLLFTDGISNGCVAVTKDEALAHLRRILKVLSTPCSISDVSYYSDPIGDSSVTYGFVSFGNKFLDYRVDGELFLISVTDNFISGLRNHIVALEVNDER